MSFSDLHSIAYGALFTPNPVEEGHTTFTACNITDRYPDKPLSIMWKLENNTLLEGTGVMGC